MTEPALAETPEDQAYVRARFVPRAAVDRPGAPFGVEIPDATYRLPDGTRWFARDVWRLADDAGGPAGVRALFARRYLAACDALRVEGERDAAWAGYLAGAYGACLRDVTPEAIAAKQRLVARLSAAIAAPAPSDPAWRAQLRADVEALDGLAQPFAACDRARFGATTRDRLIAAPRAAFPQVFASDAAAPGTVPVREHRYALDLRWTGNTGAGTDGHAGYEREFRIAIAGKPDLVGSADPAFRGARDHHNPEDLFVAALASCHMLTYLALCARHGVVVVAYHDAARARLREHGGAGRFAEVVLAPRVAIAPGGDLALARALHDRAAAGCFIASSVAIPVHHAPEIAYATDADRARPPRRGDLAVRLPDRPGALAALGEALGRAGYSVEGGGGFTVGDACVVHFLVGDAPGAAEALRAGGFEVLGTREVVVQRVDQGAPGQLGAIARMFADAGVNIEAVYSDHDHQLILGVDDLALAERASAAWRDRSP